MARVITYECEQCGSEVVVTENLEDALSPIYCCGLAITEVASAGEKPAKKKAAKKTAKKTVKKPAAKKVAKKPVAKKPAKKASKRK